MPENRDEQAKPNGQFRKGVSGNPGGRPKEKADVKDLARKHSPEAFSRILDLMRSENSRVALAASQEVLNRAWGKPETSVHATIETPVLTVIRAPEVTASTEEWRCKYAPKEAGHG